MLSLTYTVSSGGGCVRGWLIEARKEKGMIQEDVARLSGISRSYYTEIERGVKNPSGKVAVRISKILNIKPDEFFK